MLFRVFCALLGSLEHNSTSTTSSQVTSILLISNHYCSVHLCKSNEGTKFADVRTVLSRGIKAWWVAIDDNRHEQQRNSCFITK